MKKLLFSLFALALSTFAFAVGENYEPTMKGLMMKMKSANSPEAYASARNGFARVAEVEKGEWLPLYYASFCAIIEANMVQDGPTKDATLDIADGYLTKAVTLSENDEILVLQSWSKSTRIMVNPMTRGQKYGAESAQLLEKATKLNPKNPRAYFLRAQSAYYTPEAFGGSKIKAKEWYTKAAELFAKENSENTLMPTWGSEENAKMLAEVNK
jgi:hypothetical protein